MPGNHARIAIVTGATSGIGEATARKFVAAGFGVTGNGRTGAKLTALEKEIGPAFHGVAGDATDNSVLERIFTSTIEHFGKPADIVVANAGIGVRGSVKDADLSQFDNVLKTNVAGTLALLQKASQKMLDEQQSVYPKSAADIVIVGSVAGRHISPWSAVYGATKFAVHALAEGLRREVGPKGIRVSLIEPALVITGFQAVADYNDEMVDGFNEKYGPLLSGSEIADIIYYIVAQPPYVHISNITVRPTRLDYP